MKYITLLIIVILFSCSNDVSVREKEISNLKNQIEFKKDLLLVFENFISDGLKNHARAAIEKEYAKTEDISIRFDSTIIENKYPYQTHNFFKLIRKGDTILKSAKNEFKVINKKLIIGRFEVK